MRTILILTLGGVLLAACGAHAAPLPEKPNFVVILIDDMGYGDIGPFGSKKNRTPNLDRMAREGMKLTSFYAAPSCTPSRAQMMTGCYAQRVSLAKCLWPASPGGISPAEQTVADLLHQRGYATICLGKWHLGDQPEFLPTRHGFDHYLGLPYSNDMPNPPLPLLRDDKVVEAPADQDKLTALYTEEAIKFIAANKDRPFFVYLPHTAVHVPLHPGPQFRDKSANGRYGDWVEEVDWSAGRILDTLKQLKLDSKTLVLFTSDNGPWRIKGKSAGVATPLRGSKETTWEGGMREPTLAWWPGQIAAGTVCDAVTSEMDVLPTFVKLASGELPAKRKLDGKDIWPLLSGVSTQSPHEALFYFVNYHLQAVRSGPWKLAIVPQPDAKARYEHGRAMARATDPKVREELRKGKPFTPVLFNLDKDISETTNVAAQHPDVVKRLQEFVHQMDADLGVKGGGPGIRPHGIVAKPQALTRRKAIEYD